MDPAAVFSGSYGLGTVRYPVLEITAKVEPFDNGRVFTLRVLRVGKPREKQACGMRLFFWRFSSSSADKLSS